MNKEELEEIEDKKAEDHLKKYHQRCMLCHQITEYKEENKWYCAKCRITMEKE